METFPPLKMRKREIKTTTINVRDYNVFISDK